MPVRSPNGVSPARHSPIELSASVTNARASTTCIVGSPRSPASLTNSAMTANQNAACTM